MNIPTAKIFYSAKYQRETYGRQLETHEELIEFAKLHVEAALKNASIMASLTPFAQEFMQEGAESAINKHSILNAYPLINII